MFSIAALKSVYAVAFAILQDRDASTAACSDALALSRASSHAEPLRYALTMSLARAVDIRQPAPTSYDEAFRPPRRRAAHGLSEQELRSRVATAMRALSPIDRALVVLRDVERLSYRQMAEAMGWRVESIEGRLLSARRILHNRLTSLVWR